MLVLAIYFMVDMPRLRHGATRLFPAAHRARALWRLAHAYEVQNYLVAARDAYLQLQSRYPRLRLPERRVLDTLISAGVARSRSEALAWCVRLVGENEKDWISQLRDALEAVGEVRESGPRARRGARG